MRRIGNRTTSSYTVDDPDLPPRPAARYPCELVFQEALREAMFDENTHPLVPLIIFRTATWEGVLDALQALGKCPFHQALQRFGTISPNQRGEGVDGIMDQAMKLLADGRPVIVVAHDSADLGALGRAADSEYRLEPLSWDGVQRVARALTGDETAAFDAVPPWNLDDITGDTWNLAHRPGLRSATDLVRRLPVVCATTGTST